MVRQVKQTIIDDIDLIVAAFPNPNQQEPVLKRYLENQTILEETG